jgi:hypothetical protein
MHDCEDYTRGPFFKGCSTYIGKGSPVDDVWVIPSYKQSLDYISLIRGSPAYTVPHLWSPRIIEETTSNVLQKSVSDLHYNYAAHVGKKIDILILEPNIALFKNAWIPIVAAEKLHVDNPDLIDNVYVFNFPDESHALTIPEIFLHFNQKDSFPVIVSHQVLNGLNYLYYEALFFGWPLVHNSTDMEDCGYYYPGNNFVDCAKAIQEAYKSHNRQIESYKARGRKFMERVDPLHPSVGSIWNQLINAGLSKSL